MDMPWCTVPCDLLWKLSLRHFSLLVMWMGSKCERTRDGMRETEDENVHVFFAIFLLRCVCVVSFFSSSVACSFLRLSAVFSLDCRKNMLEILLTHHMRPNSHTYLWQCRPHARYWGVQYGKIGGMGESVYVCVRVRKPSTKRSEQPSNITIIFYTTGILLMPFLRFLFTISVCLSALFVISFFFLGYCCYCNSITFHFSTCTFAQFASFSSEFSNGLLLQPGCNLTICAKLHNFGWIIRLLRQRECKGK